MYALINTMSAVDVYVGRIVSQHRSAEAAEAADGRLQRKIKKTNGENSYLPTRIVHLIVRHRAGEMVARGEVRLIDRW